MQEIQKQLQQLNEQRENLLSQLEVKKANQKFLCGCGKLHKIKDCTAIQTHWYESPSGCIGGDIWHSGEIQVVCPATDNKNRFLYDSKYQVEWSLRDHYKHNAEMQFNSGYLGLFKEVIQDYDEDKRKWWNNYYVDRNHKKFGIDIGVKNEARV